MESNEFGTTYVSNAKMKKYALVGICVAFIIVLLVISGVKFFEKINVFTLSPKVAKIFTGESPEDFCSGDEQNFSLRHTFYTYAKVDRQGNLVLVMTDDQIDNWKNADFYLQLLQKIVGNERQVVSEIIPPEDSFFHTLFYEKADVLCPYEISEDYTHVYAGPEDDDFLYFPILPYMCITMQVLSGKNSDEISYTFTEFDKDGNIIEEYVWPDDVFDTNTD